MIMSMINDAGLSRSEDWERGIAENGNPRGRTEDGEVTRVDGHQMTGGKIIYFRISWLGILLLRRRD